MVTEPVFLPDATFRLSEYPELTKGLSGEDMDTLEVNAFSYKEAEFRGNKLRHEASQMRKLFAGGTPSGILAMFAGNVTDPLAFAGLVADGRIVMNMAHASKFKRFAAGGAIGGAQVGGETALMAQTQESMDAQDVAMGFFLGVGLGGSASALLGGKPGATVITKDLDNMIDDQVQRVIGIIDDSINPTYRGSLVHDPELNIDRSLFSEGFEARGGAAPMVKGTAADAAAPVSKIHKITEGADEPLTHRMQIDLELDPNYGLADDVLEKYLGFQGKKSNANKALLAEALKREKAGTLPPADAFDKGILGKLIKNNPAMSDAVAMLQSKHPMVRMIAGDLLEDATKMGSQQAGTASALTRKYSNQILGDWMPTFERELTLLRHERGVNQLTDAANGTVQKQIMNELRLEMEARSVAFDTGIKHRSSADPRIQTIADSMDDASSRALDIAKKHGVLGADQIKHRPGFMPLKWVGKNLLEAQRNGKLGRIVKLLGKSYERMGIDAADSERIANAVLTRATSNASQIDTNPARILAKDSRGFLEKILEETNVAKGDIASLMKRIDGNLDEKGMARGMRSRVSVDLSLSDGDIRLMDYVDNDIPTLFSRFSQESAGRAGLASKGITSDTRLQNVRQAVIEASQMMDSPRLTNRIRKSFDAVSQEFMAQPVGGGVNKWVRRMLEGTTNARLGMVGFAQAAETNNIIASLGLENALKASPIMRKAHKALIKAAKTNNYDDEALELFNELRVFAGDMHDEHLLYRPSVRLDDALTDDPEWISKPMAALDRVQAMASDKLGYLSGLYKIKAMQQQIAIIGQSQKMVDALTGGRTTEQILSRFKDVGWDAKMLNQFRKNMKHVTYQEDGKTIRRLNLEEWDNVAQEHFTNGLHLHTNQMVQLPMVGEGRYWQNSTLGRLLTQFKTFSITAIEKQFARNMKHMDSETMAVVFYGSMFSTMTVFAKAYATSLGMSGEQRKEYLKERTTPTALATAAVTYNGFWGVGAEGLSMLHNAGLSLGAQPGGRGAGQGFSRIEGNMPAIGLALDGINGIIKGDPDKVLGVAPHSNVLPAIWARNLMKDYWAEE
jgi:hypothetical protein